MPATKMQYCERAGFLVALSGVCGVAAKIVHEDPAHES